MAELVDALVSNTNAARRAGSIPALGTFIREVCRKHTSLFLVQHGGVKSVQSIMATHTLPILLRARVYIARRKVLQVLLAIVTS